MQPRARHGPLRKEHRRRQLAAGRRSSDHTDRRFTIRCIVASPTTTIPQEDQVGRRRYPDRQAAPAARTPPPLQLMFHVKHRPLSSGDEAASQRPLHSQQTIIKVSRETAAFVLNRRRDSALSAMDTAWARWPTVLRTDAMYVEPISRSLRRQPRRWTVGILPDLTPTPRERDSRSVNATMPTARSRPSVFLQPTTPP